LSTKIEQLEWRRSNVIEMRSRGMTHGEIASELQVSRTSITSDIQYLRNQAKESIKEYVSIYLSNTRYVLAHWILYSNMHLTYWKPQPITEKSCRQWNYSRYPSRLALDSTVSNNNHNNDQRVKSARQQYFSLRRFVF
jgi:hypothetical protein